MKTEKMLKSDKDQYLNIYTMVRNFLTIRAINELRGKSDMKPAGMEIGAGLGGNIELIHNHLRSLNAYDLSNNAVEFCRKNFPYPNVKYITGDFMKMEGDSASKYDSVFLYSVLEHMENDCEVLSGISRLLKPDGLLFLQVPGHKRIFSCIDEFCGHCRRYNADEIVSKLKSSGFIIDEFLSLGIRRLWWMEILKHRIKYGNAKFDRNERNLASSTTAFSTATKLLLRIKNPFYRILFHTYIRFAKRHLTEGVEFFIIARKVSDKQSVTRS
ncbi:MAG: class I SAM-dependent methyltransferase [Planctomycetes bacterium]|nr:class I SAM-dependent methyltransferase [Planctomycetota bacterium]